MTTTYTINQLDRNISDGFVTTVHYSVSKVDGEFFASVYGTINFPADIPETPYASLTEAQVIAWVKKQLDVEQIEAALAQIIVEQKQPTKVSGTPW
jgi:hypothetical protein